MTSEMLCALRIRTLLRLGTVLLIFGTVASGVADGPRGYGIVAKIMNPDNTGEIGAAKDVSHITAIQSWFYWSDLEPDYDEAISKPGHLLTA